MNKYGGSCNTIDNPYVKVFVPNSVKNMNVEGFNLMARLNEARFLVQGILCECKYRLKESVRNLK